jgi:hypothetical protein
MIEKKIQFSCRSVNKDIRGGLEGVLDIFIALMYQIFVTLVIFIFKYFGVVFQER